MSQPYMVVNIGSGVSFLKVRPLSQMGPTEDGSAGNFPRFERCGGTAMGGATFWGMARLITDVRCGSLLCVPPLLLTWLPLACRRRRLRKRWIYAELATQSGSIS